MGCTAAQRGRGNACRALAFLRNSEHEHNRGGSAACESTIAEAVLYGKDLGRKSCARQPFLAVSQPPLGAPVVAHDLERPIDAPAVGRPPGSLIHTALFTRCCTSFWKRAFSRTRAASPLTTRPHQGPFADSRHSASPSLLSMCA